jgi:hypothetical protein
MSYEKTAHLLGNIDQKALLRNVIASFETIGKR